MKTYPSVRLQRRPRFREGEVRVLEKLYKKIKKLRPYPIDDIQQVVECLNNKDSNYKVDTKRIKKWLDNRKQRDKRKPKPKPKRKYKPIGKYIFTISKPIGKYIFTISKPIGKYTFTIRHAKNLCIRDLFVSVICTFGDKHWVAGPLDNKIDNYNIDISDELE